MSDGEDETSSKKGARTATDVQRMRLEKLMKNIVSEIFIYCQKNKSPSSCSSTIHMHKVVLKMVERSKFPVSQ